MVRDRRKRHDDDDDDDDGGGGGRGATVPEMMRQLGTPPRVSAKHTARQRFYSCV